MADNIKYLEIDASAGIAEVELVVSVESVISITVSDGSDGESGFALKLGTEHTDAFYGDWGYTAYLHSRQPHAALNEPQFNAWLASNPLTPYITDAPADGTIYGRKDNAWIANDSYVTTVTVRKDTQFPIHYIEYTNKNGTTTVTDIPKGNGVIFGGYVNWIENLDFSVGAAAYYIGGDLYTINTSSNIGLDAADPTNPRIDVIVVDIYNSVSVITGVPSVNPQKPTPDPLTQIELTQVLIPAGATEPAGFDVEVVFDENLEWTTGYYTGTTVDFESTENFFYGATGGEVTDAANGHYVSFLNPTGIAVADYDYFVMYFNLKESMTNNQDIVVTFFDNGTAVSTSTILPIAKSQVNSWQVINLQLAAQQFTQSTFNRIVVQWRNKQATIHDGFYFDYFKLEKGITQYLQINETDPIFTAWRNAAQGSGDKYTNVDAGNFFDMSVTDDYLYICVQGGPVGTAIWKKIALFHT